MAAIFITQGQKIKGLPRTPTNILQSCQNDNSMYLKPIHYSTTQQLIILQYNVHTTQGKVIVSPLADHGISEFTFLAIQEPWQNPHIHTTHNPCNSSIHLFYPASADSVYFFVNKSQHPRSYSAAFHTPECSHLCLRRSVEGARDVMIHTVYSTGNISFTFSGYQPPEETL